MRLVHRLALVLLGLFVLAAPAGARGQVRVASYNIQFLNKDIAKERAKQIQAVLAKLDADVIGLQEIEDRAALERVFPRADWQLVIDDASNDRQDLAVAVRKPFKVVNLKGDPTNGLSAGDGDFLFPGAGNNVPFPNRRDVLCVEVEVPQTGGKTFSVLVHHAKARVGGRNLTEQRRVGAARLILQVLETRFDEKDFVLLGDFNDNPDDRSLNILETGDPDAPASMEETDGPFLINLCEPLVKKDHVTHGARATNVVGGRLDPTVAGSRKKNFDALGTDVNTGPILFDNLLIPIHMKARAAGPAAIFGDPAAVAGGAHRASDHLPVYADLAFGAAVAADDDDGAAPAGVRIAALLPNPTGPDNGNEWVEVQNGTAEAVKLVGWRLRDRGGNLFNLDGELAAGAKKRFTLPAGALPLNNGGDDVVLTDAAGATRHRVSYRAAQAGPGAVVTFD